MNFAYYNNIYDITLLKYNILIHLIILWQYI